MMYAGRFTTLFAVLLLVGGSQRMACAEGLLAVCLDEDVPPYSFHHGKETGGFDLAVAKALAARLGRTLKVQWFESKLDEESSSVLAADALLSDGRCDLVGGYPLLRDALGKPSAETARLPDYDGATPADRRRRVALGTLVPSRPYYYAPLVIVLGPEAGSRHIDGLAELEGLKLIVESGTLADAILMTFDDGRLVNQIVHVRAGRGELLPRLEQGDRDATLIALRRYDAYRAEHPETQIKVSGYYQRVGFNMGFVGLSKATELIAEVNHAIDDMASKGELPALAQAAGMTYVAPRPPDVRDTPSLSDLGRP
jgi:ABC-type amino acid transport substrate-binding protein